MNGKILKPQKAKATRFGTINLNVSVLSSLFAVVVGLLIGFVILLVSNPSQALAAFMAILIGPLKGGMVSIGNVLYYSMPIIMTGLSVGFAFKTGLFNIGASGQFIVGAYGAVLVGVTCTFLGPVHWLAALITAVVFGSLWAGVVGVLKAYANVNEVITSIMMNYLGMLLVNYLVVKTVYNSLKNQSLDIPPSAVIPDMGLNYLFGNSHVNGGIFIAVLAVVVMHIVLNKTTFGFEQKAVGYNREASRYAGINEKRSIVLSMMIAGALSGLGGGLLYLAGTGKCIHVVEVLAAEGFTGISVALLGLSTPIGVLLAGLFIGYITLGGFNMQLFNFAPEIIDIIKAVIIYFSAFALIFKGIINNRNAKILHQEEMLERERQAAALSTAAADSPQNAERGNSK
ncbi:MAG: ABC transporter permease [Clostridia bacterium]|nr:ABC transporter permease [Clostridia bacterium]